jgi:peptidyl-dipeptidase Dcp
MNTFRNRGLENGENKFAIVYNVCNFAKPTKTQPTMLDLDEVTTTAHEFTHAIHALVAQGNYPSLTGTNVKWDFVEMPSQLGENYFKEKEVLDTFAVHYKTGEQLPAALIKKINDMENFNAAYAGLRQTFLGLLDMKWYTTDPANIKSAEELEDSVAAQASLLPRIAAPISLTFGHIFTGGYDAGYYGYKWSERIEAAFYSVFKKNGLYDRKTADRLVDKCLSKGGTVDEEKQVTDFLGGPVDQNAQFRREGLLPPEDKKSAKSAPPRPLNP